LGSVYGSTPSSSAGVSLGYLSLANLPTGSVAIGSNSQTGTSGLLNTSIGSYSLANVSSGFQNTASGYSSGINITTGTDNVTEGYYAGSTLITGSNNVIIGSGAEPTSATTSNEITLGNASVSRFRVPGLGINWTTANVPTALPSQSGNSGKYLTTDGTTASWATASTDATPTAFLLGGM
jgi:hypothetical protein